VHGHRRDRRSVEDLFCLELVLPFFFLFGQKLSPISSLSSLQGDSRGCCSCDPRTAVRAFSGPGLGVFGFRV